MNISSGGLMEAQSFAENKLSFTPTEFISVLNQTLEYAYSSVLITGEVASFKVNQGKWAFFDLKDENSSVSCFMALWELRVPIEDGMKVTVRGVPKITKWGKFSFTVSNIKPVGEGSLKKAYELLKEKLAKEGLFDKEKKRLISNDLTEIGVISSTQAAGYADFIKIINARWGGMKVKVAHTQVQGLDAPDQIIRALDYFNERGEVQAIVIIRGGGSADDLSCFNDELLVRKIASSRIPVITGIGHEVDETLSDLVADVRASTPSNVAELLTKDRKEEKNRIKKMILQTGQVVIQEIERVRNNNYNTISVKCYEKIGNLLSNIESTIKQKIKLLEALNPEMILRQGYAIVTGKMSVGERIKITLLKKEINAEIINIKEREKNE